MAWRGMQFRPCSPRFTQGVPSVSGRPGLGSWRSRYIGASLPWSTFWSCPGGDLSVELQRTSL